MNDLRAILLVEDSLADAEMAIDALRDARLANPIVHVEDGVEAMEYLRRTGAHAARPHGNPAVVLREIRGDDALRRVPVVILSSSREERDLAASWDLGVNAYVVKPVDADQFFDAVRALGQFWAVMNEARPGD